MITEQHIPLQYKGARSQTVYSIRKRTIKSAIILFEKARTSLLNINEWHTISGSGARFQLVNEEGYEVKRSVHKGDYIRISLPAIPGSTAGEGYEWVLVEQLEDRPVSEPAYTIIQVRPSSPPFIESAETGHFFSADASSNFCVERTGRKITAIVYGRNEAPNVQVSRIIDKVRNFLVAVGAMLGFNKPQWKSLVKGLLKETV